MVYWTIGALKTRRTAKRESFVARYSIMLVEVSGFVLLFDSDLRTGILERHVMVRSFPWFFFGVALTWIGIALALWARWHLGQYWSGRITIKEDHKLIRTGPYARLRHPIYSGLDMAAIGGALVFDKWRSLAGLCLVVAGFWIKARREERLLSAQFGDAFAEHRRATGFLLPKL